MPAAFLDFNDIWDCYWWDICNIQYIYGLYMNKIFPIISLIWFRNGFSKVQRGCNNIKIVYISNFSQFRSRGGLIENQFFPKFKKVQIILGEGGSRKFWTFSTNYGILYFEPSPNPSCFDASDAPRDQHTSVRDTRLYSLLEPTAPASIRLKALELVTCVSTIPPRFV